MATKYFGIDIGTQNTRIAFSKDTDAQLILNQAGNKNTPTCVSITRDSRILGTIAEQKLIIYPANTVNTFTRLLAKKFDHPMTSLEQRFAAFSITCDSEQNTEIKLIVDGKTRRYSPEELLAMHFQEMNEIAGNCLKSNVAFCAPDFFLDRESQAIIDASIIAGFSKAIIFLYTDSICIYYMKFNNSLPSTESKKTIIFVDLGHTHLSVSVCSINRKESQILAIVCDPYIGGRDFDQVIYDEMNRQAGESLGPEIIAELRTKARLLKGCVKLKHMLTTNKDEMTLDTQFYRDENEFSSNMDRKCFEDLSKNIIISIKATLEKALEISAIAIENIDSIELLGAGSRVPMFRDAVGHVYGTAEKINIIPEEAAALGCALMSNENTKSKFKVQGPSCKKFSQIRLFSDNGEDNYAPLFPVSMCECPGCKEETQKKKFEYIRKAQKLSYAEQMEPFLSSPMNPEKLNELTNLEGLTHLQEQKKEQCKQLIYVILRKLLEQISHQIFLEQTQEEEDFYRNVMKNPLNDELFLSKEKLQIRHLDANYLKTVMQIKKFGDFPIQDNVLFSLSEGLERTLNQKTRICKTLLDEWRNNKQRVLEEITDIDEIKSTINEYIDNSIKVIKRWVISTRTLKFLTLSKGNREEECNKLMGKKKDLEAPTVSLSEEQLHEIQEEISKFSDKVREYPVIPSRCFLTEDEEKMGANKMASENENKIRKLEEKSPDKLRKQLEDIFQRLNERTQALKQFSKNEIGEYQDFTSLSEGLQKTVEEMDICYQSLKSSIQNTKNDALSAKSKANPLYDNTNSNNPNKNGRSEPSSSRSTQLPKHNMYTGNLSTKPDNSCEKALLSSVEENINANLSVIHSKELVNKKTEKSSSLTSFFHLLLNFIWWPIDFCRRPFRTTTGRK